MLGQSCTYWRSVGCALGNSCTCLSLHRLKRKIEWESRYRAVTQDFVHHGSGRVHFFFSSRRRHTRLQGDWSSDVCSSDLTLAAPRAHLHAELAPGGPEGPADHPRPGLGHRGPRPGLRDEEDLRLVRGRDGRSEEHTSELQSPCNLVCRLLLEKKKYKGAQH